ncbi:MAG: DUF459 domain-containing protein [Rhizobiaceae bacterium]|nr:MAG: DUF459 domain-containing protein [Rhizobiaceae bacterium]CAG0965519.1 hypothetical protein RHIZO_00936 [Rhizobiaceae bacterium]
MAVDDKVHGPAPFRLLRLILLLAAALAVAAAPALAQEQRKSRNLFEFLFGGPVRSEKPAKPAAKNTTRKKSVRTEPTEAAVAVVEKAGSARTVLVIGDFMAGGLAEGLTTVFAANPDIKVVEKARGSSGFVRDDVFNWPAEIRALIDAEKPAAVVVMLGANDRQQLRAGDVREQLLTDGWTKEYRTRTAAFAAAVAESKVPLVWVGLPAFKQKKMLSDMIAFNDLYRQAAEQSGGAFVDIWDGFVDENGAFVMTGPDINGQPVRLRGDDGINLSRAGKRKVAFYVEKPLFKALGIPGASGTVLPAIAALPDAVHGPQQPVDIDRTPPISLSDPNLDGGMELLGASFKSPADARTAAGLLAVEGGAPEPSRGRADDFVERPQQTDAVADTKVTTSAVAE